VDRFQRVRLAVSLNPLLLNVQMGDSL
jgi:hypothetical protein